MEESFRKLVRQIEIEMHNGQPGAYEHRTQLIRYLEDEVDKSTPGALQKLLYLRKRYGLCHDCGLQGIIKCCTKIRCGSHSLEHLELHTAVREMTDDSDQDN